MDDELRVFRESLHVDPPVRLADGDDLAELVLAMLEPVLQHRCEVIVRMTIELQHVLNNTPPRENFITLPRFRFNRDTPANRVDLYQHIQHSAEREADRIEESDVIAHVT